MKQNRVLLWLIHFIILCILAKVAKKRTVDRTTVKKITTPHHHYIKTTQCHIPYYPIISKIKKHSASFNCSKDKSLISNRFDEKLQHYVLQINYPVAQLKLKVMRKKFPNLMGYNCTYREIRRLKNASAEEPMSLGEETAFEDGYVVPLHIEAMKVICRNELSEDLQMDTFAFVQPRRSIPLQKSWHRRPSIIMLGMDNLSRMTLRNNMPSLFENIKKP
ncbi:uncharacterized protein LOC123257457 [Drosophila ananassae]|nr:uncharacterized protein LOC123257457 [Drosophila ananassae]